MTLLAWVFLASTWSVIIGCTLYSFCKLMFSTRGLDEDPK